ncbi:MAG: hypothetical protein HZA08_03855 [Nitrospirae bacterium]|nr:hypothetical protein [Nitrospirota bacterium]
MRGDTSINITLLNQQKVKGVVYPSPVFAVPKLSFLGQNKLSPTTAALRRTFQRRPLNNIPVTITSVERIELQSGKYVPVLEVKVESHHDTIR